MLKTVKIVKNTLPSQLDKSNLVDSAESKYWVGLGWCRQMDTDSQSGRHRHGQHKWVVRQVDMMGNWT